MIKKLLVFITFFIFIINVNSQEKKILINGKISDSLGLVKNVNIINLKTKLGTFSNDLGLFRIFVVKGDTLRISSVQHSSKKIVITDKILLEKNIQILLKLNTYTLDEFELKKHNLMGRIGIDTKSVPIHKKDSLLRNVMDFSDVNFTNKDFRIDENIKAKSKIVNTVANTYSGLKIGNLLKKINPFKKQKKEKSNKEDFYFKETFPKKLLAELGNDFFFKNLKIPKDKYYHFLDYCKPLNIEELYKNGKLLDVIEIVRKQSTLYLKVIKVNK